MSDVRVNCPSCSEELEVAEELLGHVVNCPACSRSILLPIPKRKIANPKSKKPSHAPRSYEKHLASQAAGNPGGPASLLITRRSGWSGFLTALGIVNFIIGLGGCMVTGDRIDTGTPLIFLVVGMAVGLQCLFFSFLVNVFTDIRWFLKQLVDRE